MDKRSDRCGLAAGVCGEGATPGFSGKNSGIITPFQVVAEPPSVLVRLVRTAPSTRKRQGARGGGVVLSRLPGESPGDRGSDDPQCARHEERAGAFFTRICQHRATGVSSQQSRPRCWNMR